MTKRKNNSKYVLRGQGRNRRWALKAGAKQGKAPAVYVKKSSIVNRKPDAVDIGALLASTAAGSAGAFYARRDAINNKIIGPYRTKLEGIKTGNASSVVSSTMKINDALSTRFTPRGAAVGGAIAGAALGAGVYALRNNAHKNKMARKMQRELDIENGFIQPKRLKLR